MNYHCLLIQYPFGCIQDEMEFPRRIPKESEHRPIAESMEPHLWHFGDLDIHSGTVCLPETVLLDSLWNIFYIQSYIYIFIHTYILYSVPRFTHHFEVSILNERCRVKFGRSIWFVWNLLHVGVTSNHSGLVEDVEFHLLSSEFDSNSLKHTASVANKELIHWQKKQHPFFHRYFNVQRTRAGGLSAQQGGMFQIPHNCRFHGLAVPHTSTARRVRKVASKDSLFVIFQVSFWCRSHPDVYFYSGKVT